MAAKTEQCFSKMFPQLIIIFFFFFFLLSMPLPSSQTDAKTQIYSDCIPRPFICGGLNFNISYPFQIDGRLPSCGHPGYVLRCINNTTLVTTISDREYQVMAIDYPNLHIVVSDASFIGSSCPVPVENTTIDLSLYQYADLNKAVTFFMNCTLSGGLPPGLHNLSCYAGNTYFYVVGDGNSNGAGGSCGSEVQLMMHQAVVDLVMRGEIVLGDALQQGFTLKWTAGDGWCEACVAAGGSCGYNLNSSSKNTCICDKGSCSLAGKRGVKRKALIGSTVALACFLLVCIPLYFYIAQNNRLNNLIFWKKNNIAQTIEAFLDACEYLGPKRYRYSALKKMTKSFSEKLGQGGYGAVFKGEFPDGRLVAVKVLTDAKGNGDEFVNEVASIGRTSHVNVVSLLGFCSEGSKRALIYEFMPNGSLEKYIYSEDLKSALGWDKLYQIAAGIARGLEYLHRGCGTHIVHFDIKPHNILLDQDFCPKISDFGLAQLCLRKDSIFSAIGTRGTIGYIAPEVFSRNFGIVSSKSDVYSYGMMILEMVGVRNSSHSRHESDSGYYFPHWIYEHYHQIGNVEGLDVAVEAVEIAKKMVLVGLWCSQTKPVNRPSMSKVVDMLQSSIDELEMPPKPSLSSP